MRSTRTCKQNKIRTLHQCNHCPPTLNNALCPRRSQILRVMPHAPGSAPSCVLCAPLAVGKKRQGIQNIQKGLSLFIPQKGVKFGSQGFCSCRSASNHVQSIDPKPFFPLPVKSEVTVIYPPRSTRVRVTCIGGAGSGAAARVRV